MKRRSLLGLLAAVPLAQSLTARAATQVQVYKNPSCGCCTGWVDHLKAAGFVVAVTETDDTGPLRKRLGVPDRLAGCHTGVVEGYALEGHVPAAEVKRLLALKPNAVGLAVPACRSVRPAWNTATARSLITSSSSGATPATRCLPAIPGELSRNPRR